MEAKGRMHLEALTDFGTDACSQEGEEEGREGKRGRWEDGADRPHPQQGASFELAGC